MEKQVMIMMIVAAFALSVVMTILLAPLIAEDWIVEPCLEEHAENLCSKKGMVLGRSFRQEVTCIDSDDKPVEYRLSEKLSEDCYGLMEMW